ncbi:MAG: amidohydrolase [Peptococcaceae bacterium]|nr:amidohydrolase [Peptococcaceae bacterium]
MRTIIFNCRALTMNQAMPEATAAVTDGEEILYVGSDSQALSFAHKDARIIDARGGSLLPGFNDSHMHLLGFGLHLRTIDCREFTSISSLQEQVAERASMTPQGEFIVGRGWDQNKWPGGRYPCRFDLDSAAPNHPVVLFRACGHVLVANSLALQLAKVDATTLDVLGGSFDRTEQGELTGVLREKAMEYVYVALPEITPHQISQALAQAAGYAVSRGLTTVQTHDGSGSEWQQIVQMYQTLKLPLRVNVLFNLDREQILLDGEHMLAINAKNSDRLGVKTIKIMADGSLGARTAAMSEPYTDDPLNKGLSYYTQDSLNALVSAAHQAGFQVAIHAIGDFTAEQAIRAIESAQGSNKTRRHRLIHCQVLRRDLVERMARAGIVAEIQPIFVTTDLHWTKERIGKERLSFAYAWKSLLEFGVQCAGGSDCPVETMDPLAGITAAVTRTDGSGYPSGGWLPREKLSVREAIALFTVGSAYAEHMETIKGQIKPHFAADLVLLEGDIEAVPPLEIKNMRVKMTMVAGRVVFEQS